MKASTAEHVPSTSAEATGDGGRTLLEDIKVMHTDAAFVDMVFVCGEGEEEEEIGACRMVVASRSPVLKSMLLTSGMAESKLHRVSLPSIAPATMRVCLEFFYTDTVQHSSWPLSILSAMKVVEAAIFFLLTPLQHLAISYMRRNFRGSFFSGKVSNQSFEYIQAYNLGAQILSAQQHKSDKMRDLLSMLRSRIHSYIKRYTNQERHVYKSFSQMAVAHFSQMPLPVSQQALCEYFSFDCLVKWSAYRLVTADPSINEGELEEVLKRCFPQSVNQVSTATKIDSDDVNVSRLIKLIRDPLAQCLQTVPVEFANIPTDILCKLIEPLDVLPPSTLLNAYKRQALYRPELLWDQLCHGQEYNIEVEDLTVISCKGLGFQGFARCNTYLNAANMTCFDWRIVMLSLCENLRIGLCVWDPSFTTSDCNTHVLGDIRGSWALGGDGFLHHTTLANEKRCAAYVDAFHSEKGVVIEVHVDMVNMNCSFSINGKKAKVAWENLLTGCHPLYPAISLQKPGKAQLEMLYHNWMDCPRKTVQSLNSVVMSS